MKTNKSAQTHDELYVGSYNQKALQLTLWDGINLDLQGIESSYP